MTRPLSSYPEPFRRVVAMRRFAKKSIAPGLGELSAQDYLTAKQRKLDAKTKSLPQAVKSVVKKIVNG